MIFKCCQFGLNPEFPTKIQEKAASIDIKMSHMYPYPQYGGGSWDAYQHQQYYTGTLPQPGYGYVPSNGYPQQYDPSMGVVPSNVYGGYTNKKGLSKTKI